MQGVLAPAYELFAEPKAGARCVVPAGTDVEVYRAAIEELPLQEGPEVFGLHPNADLTFRSLQARLLSCACSRGTYVTTSFEGGYADCRTLIPWTRPVVRLAKVWHGTV